MDVIHQFRRYLTQPHVRPWALLAPILILLVCLPLLRPLRHPDPGEISDDELARLATVQSLVEHRTLAIDGSTYAPTHGTVRRGAQTFSAQPPAMAVVLAGPYWVMQACGLTLRQNPVLVPYLLTLLGVTIPVAAGAGLIYRMGRMFELPRKKRALLAVAVGFGSGLVSYAVVLNAHAPAAALVLASAACLIHVSIAKRPTVTSGWLAIAGMCAGLAAVTDPAAVCFLVLFLFAIPVMRWRWLMKFGGVTLYVLGALPPLLLHVTLTQPITHQVVAPMYFSPAAIVAGSDARPQATAAAGDDADDVARASTWWDIAGRNLNRLLAALLGDHGVFSHFPVLILGAFGVSAVMHRHWPATTKVLATATVVSAAAILVVCCVAVPASPGTMFGPQVFIVALPMMLFWAGAWLRRPHGPLKLSLAGCAMVFSVVVTVIGATDPYPRGGYDRYTFAQALTNLIRPAPAVQPPPILAGG